MSANYRDREKRERRRLGILILSDPEAQDLQTVQGLCQTALEGGVQVEIFLMADAVYYLGDPALDALAKKGVSLSFCALNAMERSLHQRPQYPWGFEEGTQYNLASMVEASDRFLVFG